MYLCSRATPRCEARASRLLRSGREGNEKHEEKYRRGVRCAAPATPVAATKTAGGKVAATEKDVSQKIKKIEALGGVIVTSKEQKATGDRADFMMRENIVILTGNVVVSQGQNVMRGDKLVVELTTSRAHMEAAATGKPGPACRACFCRAKKDEKKKDGSDKASKTESGKKHKSQSQSESISPIH